jgi:hypothetical protein
MSLCPNKDTIEKYPMTAVQIRKKSLTQGLAGTPYYDVLVL